MAEHRQEIQQRLHLCKVLMQGDKPIIENIYTLNEAESIQFPLSEQNIKAWIQTDMETFSMLDDAYQVFLNTVQDVETKLQSGNPVPSVREELIRINSAFLSLLSLGRLYVDHTLSKISSARPADLAKFNEATSKEFDEVFAYRFFYQLRNYAQHRGMPLTGLSASGSINLDTGEAEYTFDLAFLKQELINFKDIWSQKVWPDLKAAPERLPASKLTSDYMKCMRRIRSASVKIFMPIIVNDVEFMKMLNTKANGYTPVYIIVGLENIGKSGTETIADIHMRDLPIQLIDFVRSYS